MKIARIQANAQTDAAGVTSAPARQRVKEQNRLDREKALTEKVKRWKMNVEKNLIGQRIKWAQTLDQVTATKGLQEIELMKQQMYKLKADTELTAKNKDLIFYSIKEKMQQALKTGNEEKISRILLEYQARKSEAEILNLKMGPLRGLVTIFDNMSEKGGEIDWGAIMRHFNRENGYKPMPQGKTPHKGLEAPWWKLFGG